MAILIYRNKLNDEMKRFSRFAKDINTQNHCIFFSEKKLDFYKECSNYSTLVFITHGDKSNLFHRYYRKHNKPHQILFDEDNISQLKDKNIFAISCGTSCNLGKTAIKKGANVYLGMKKSIHFDKEDFSITVKGHHDYSILLKNEYKKIFKLAIERATNENRNFQWLKIFLENSLAKEVQKNMNLIKQENEDYFDKAGLKYILAATRHVSQNIELHGNGKERFN